MPDTTLPIAPDAAWLAPLAGFSDLPFRLLCREHGCRAAVTEMVSAKGLCFSSTGTEPLLDTHEDDTPLVVQLFGSEVEYIEKAMHILLERGFTHFDLNAGCPVKKVVKTGSGSKLMETPELLFALAAKMAKLAPGRTGVKFRRGWRHGRENYLDVAKGLEDAGVAWLALHPRYARQGYSGTAEWDCLRQAKQAVSVPLLASGDLFSARDGHRCIEETGVDGVMFARGALYGPRIFSEFNALRRGEEPAPLTAQQLIDTVRRHAELARELLNERAALLKMRTIVPRYVKHLPGARKLRAKVVTCVSWERLDQVVEQFARQALED